MNPLKVTPLRTDPDTITDPLRRRVHAARCDAQHAAATARTELIDRLIGAGWSPSAATDLIDDLIMTVRMADAYRLEYARGVIRDVNAWEFWDGVGDLNAAFFFLHDTVRAYPVEPAPET
jgi:hypothetical protein